MGGEHSARALARLQAAHDLVARDGGGRQGRLAYHLAALMAREHLIANDAAAARRLLDSVAGAALGLGLTRVQGISNVTALMAREHLIANDAAAARRLLDSVAGGTLGFLLLECRACGEHPVRGAPSEHAPCCQCRHTCGCL